MPKHFKHIPNNKDDREEFLYGLYRELRGNKPSIRATLMEIEHKIEYDLGLRALENMCKRLDWEQTFNLNSAPSPTKDTILKRITPQMISPMGMDVSEISVPVKPKSADDYDQEEKRLTLKNIFHYWVQGRYHMDALCTHHGVQYHEVIAWCHGDNDLFEMLERAERATSLRRNMLFREGAYLRLVEQFERPTYEEVQKIYQKETQTGENGEQVEVWKETEMRVSIRRNKVDASALSWSVLMARQLEATNVTRPMNAIERTDQMGIAELEAKEQELIKMIEDKKSERDKLINIHDGFTDTRE